MDYWEDSASRLITEYRDRNEEVKKQETTEKAMLRSNDLVEVAYQTASQLIVGLLTPEINPIVRYLFGKPIMPVPTFHGLFVASFLAKMMLDCGVWFEWALLSWLPRVPRESMMPPWHRLNLEITCMSTIVGLGLGHFANSMGRHLERSHHNICEKIWFLGGTALWHRIPQYIFRDIVGRVLKCIPMLGTVGFAPAVAQTLIELSKEAQQRRRFIAQVAIQRVCWNFRELWKEHPEWIEDDANIPMDMLCPITRLLFVDPVVINGMVFERHAAEQWIAKKCRHPILTTNCTQEDIKPATEMKALVKEFASQNGLKLKVPKTS